MPLAPHQEEQLRNHLSSLPASERLQKTATPQEAAVLFIGLFGRRATTRIMEENGWIAMKREITVILSKIQ